MAINFVRVALHFFNLVRKELTMTIVEKNDVDISKLFHWSKKFLVEDESGNTVGEFYMRLLGDADNARAKVHSIRRSADLRAKLRDESSDEYVVTFSNIETLEKERLVQLLLVFNLRPISQKALKEVKVKLPKQPRSDASTEDMEKYQKEVDLYPIRREEALKEFMEKESKKLEKEYLKLSEQELVSKVKTAMINDLCEDELLKTYREMAAYLGTFRDEQLKEQLFESIDSFRNLPSYIKAQFVNAYQSLEMSGEELKKLREAAR